MMKTHQIIFYDFEVFKHDWLVVIQDFETRKKLAIINDVAKLKKFYESHKDSIWVGYNSRHYDQFILKGILSGLDPWYVNDQIINHDRSGYQIVPDASNYPVNNFDVATLYHSLKQLEGFMGSTIKESSVPFGIDRPLTQEELDETLKYCTHDVEQTIEVFNNRRDEFDSQMGIINAFDLPLEMINKTKAQSAAHVLGAVRQEHNDEYNIVFPDTIQLSEKYQYIADWYKVNKDASKKQNVTVAGVPHVFGWGGLHGALDNYADEGIILCCDVASLYPSIMIEYGFLSRNVTSPEKYREIRDTRLQYKAEKNSLHYPLKIMLNSTFGASKDKHNDLFDPLMANNICIGGQLLLLDLIEKLEPYCKLIQSNTDGLFLKVDNEKDVEVIKTVAAEWEKRVRLTLEWDVYAKIYQKDVNNYIIIDAKGKYKSKGAYVKELSEIDYDLPILNKALVEYFVHGTPVEETVNGCNSLREFQKIVKISRLYKGVVHGETPLKERVLRVFASVDENAPGILKIKKVMNKKTKCIEERLEKIAHTPPRCYIHNDNVLNERVPQYLDKQYYVEVAQKRLSDFLDPKVKIGSNKSDIKFVSQDIKDEVLATYEKGHSSFIDFLVDVVENTSANSRQIEILTILNYFSEYGYNRKLREVYLAFRKLYKKNLKSKLSRLPQLYEIEVNTPDKMIYPNEYLFLEQQYIGSMETTYPKELLSGKIGEYLVVKVEASEKSAPKLILYNLFDGETKTIKIKRKDFYRDGEQRCDTGDTIDIKATVVEPHRVPKDGDWVETGKMVEWLTSFSVYRKPKTSAEAPNNIDTDIN